MKNYNFWMSVNDSSEETVFDLCEKSLVKINGSIDNFEVIVNDANEWQKNVDNIFLIKKSIFNIQYGDVITYDNQNYLVFFMPEDRDFFISAKTRLCNSTYPIKANATKTLKLDSNGKPILDKFGDPSYTYTEGETTYIPCIVESSIIAADENKQLPLPEGQLRVTMQYQIIDDIQVNKTFNMYNNTYKIRTIDYTKVVNDKGIMTLSVEQVPSEVK